MLITCAAPQICWRNDEARMTNHEGVLINDEVRMTNDEGMTKSKAQEPGSADDSFRNGDAEWVIREEPEKKRVYDLEERTARFGEAVIDFAKAIPQSPITNRLISQLVPKGSTRNKAFPPHDCSGGARAEAGSTRAMDGSQGAAFDLLKNLERPKE